MPASVAACWPKLRLSHTGRTHSCVAGQPADHRVGVVRAVVVHQHHLVDPGAVPAGGEERGSGEGASSLDQRRASVAHPGRPEPPRRACARGSRPHEASSPARLARRPPPPRSRKAGRSAAGGARRAGRRRAGPLDGGRDLGQRRHLVRQRPRRRHRARETSSEAVGGEERERAGEDVRRPDDLEPAGLDAREPRAARVAAVVVVVLVEVGPRPLVGRHATAAAATGREDPGHLGQRRASGSQCSITSKAATTSKDRRRTAARRRAADVAGLEAARVDVERDPLATGSAQPADARTVGAADVEHPAGVPTYRRSATRAGRPGRGTTSSRAVDRRRPSGFHVDMLACDPSPGPDCELVSPSLRFVTAMMGARADADQRIPRLGDSCPRSLSPTYAAQGVLCAHRLREIHRSANSYCDGSDALVLERVDG